MANRAPVTGADELRRAVPLFDSCRAGFNDRFTAEELIKLYRAHVASGWIVSPAATLTATA